MLSAHFVADSGNLFFFHGGFRDDIGESSTGQELHDDPDLSVVSEALDEVHQVRMLELFQDLNRGARSESKK